MNNQSCGPVNVFGNIVPADKITSMSLTENETSILADKASVQVEVHMYMRLPAGYSEQPITESKTFKEEIPGGSLVHRLDNVPDEQKIWVSHFVFWKKLAVPKSLERAIEKEWETAVAEAQRLASVKAQLILDKIQQEWKEASRVT